MKNLLSNSLKKAIIITSVILFSGSLSAQFNFYNWDLNSVLTDDIAPNTSICVSETNNVYYFRDSDHSICGYWENSSGSGYSYLNQSAPKGGINSNIVSVDNYLYYITDDDYLCVMEFDHNSGNWSYTELQDCSIKQNTRIDASSNNIYFVNNSDNLIWNYWRKTDGSFGFSCLNVNAPESAGWANVTANGSIVYYQTVDNTICYLSFTGRNWTAYELDDCYVKPNTNITVGNNNIYFINSSDNKIWNYYQISNNVYGFSCLNENASIPAIGSEIVFLDSHIYYISVNDEVHTLYWNGCQWYEKVLNELAGFGLLHQTLDIKKSDNLYFVTNKQLKQLIAPEFNEGQVYVKGEELMMDGNNYNPINVNVGVTIMTNASSSEFWVGPHAAYGSWKNNKEKSFMVCDDPVDCEEMLEDYFLDIKELGFESIRVFGMSVDGYENDDPNDINNNLNFTAYRRIDGPVKIELNSGNMELYLSKIDKVIEIAEDAGLKVIWLAGCKWANTPYSSDRMILHDNYCSYLSLLADRFDNNNTLMSIDVFNEPNMNGGILDKEYSCWMVDEWYNSIRNNNDNTLVTIGLERPDDVMNWDATLMNVDYLSFHFYAVVKPSFGSISKGNGIEEARGVFKKYVKWTSNAMAKVSKPWIIGETGFSASTDPTITTEEGTAEDQRDFGIFSMDLCFECNSKGYSWWQYREINWTHSPLSKYYGLVDLLGSRKPIIGDNQNIFDNYIPSISCVPCLEDLDANIYYNIDPNCLYQINGTIKDEDGNIIENACVIGHSAGWSDIKYTFSKPDGTFILSTDFDVQHLKVSAISKSTMSPAVIQNGMVITLHDAGCTNTNASVPKEFGSISFKSKAFGVEKDIKIYPNPAINEVIIEYNNNINIGNYELVNSQGVIVKKGLVENSRTYIETGNLPSGIYIFNIRINDLWQKEKLMIMND